MFPLNPAQREAVHYIDGPLLVLAGAGSGKTRVIAAKVAHLAERGLDPARIVAITFTNKAAREMRERVDTLWRQARRGDDGGAVVIATFHALGLRVLRSEAAAAGLKRGFSVLGPDDTEPIVGELLATTDRARIRATQVRLSRWKNALLSPVAALAAATAASADGDADEAVVAARIYARYEDTLRAYQAVDFDDLIALPIRLFEQHPAIAARWRERCGHVLVDEYQDTNPAQYRLLRLLTGEAARLTAVGDDDQAIYGWRGATIDNLAQLQRDYPALKVVKLEQNYRSTVRILRAANALIAHNPKLFEKRLWSDLGHGEPIRVATTVDDEAEAELVVRRVSAHRFETRSSYGDYAILYRGNHQARVLEQALRAHNVPYTVSGGQSYFDRAEIKDIVAYLRIVANDADDPAFIRAVTTPRRGFGASGMERLAAIAAARGESLYTAAFAPETGGLPAKPREALGEFCRLVGDLRSRAPREPAGRLLDELVGAIGYRDWLLANGDAGHAAARWQGVVDFIGWLGRKGDDEHRNLLELTQMIALVTTLEGQEAGVAEAVRLSTLHAAKGLEFPHVYLVGLEEGILPHREAIAAGTVDEERRLLYVGLTRAQRSLHLSHCRRRRRAGEGVPAEPSRFLDELPQEDLRRTGAPVPPREAAAEKENGLERLRRLRAAVARSPQSGDSR